MMSFQEYYRTYNDNSYIRQLNPDSETKANYPNKETRPVKSGHYVESVATPIPDPYMIHYSDSLARQLRIPTHVMESNDMLKYLTGHNQIVASLTSDGAKQVYDVKQWVTSYALSIYGQKMISNCPYKNNSGYGDGRLHSVGEFVVNDQRWELQLKGSGKTPFSRSADGRAVLRSSIREYLASEAMHALGVPTTRALSLIVSMTEKVERSWYKLNIKPEQSDDTSESESVDKSQSQCQLNSTCGLKDKTCGTGKCNLEQKCNISQTCGYNETQEMNPVAIVCRACSSFIRVGQIELFGIRASETSRKDIDLRLQELKLIFEHMVFREYPQFLDLPMADAVVAVCDEFAIKISSMVSHWMRVGYVQSNFNSDNCLVSGKTMDYGPFGFLEKYDPDKNFWTGSGQHFGFMNQLNAAKKNYISFVNSLKPLLGQKNHQDKLNECIDRFDTVSQQIMNNMWARKLGLTGLNWKIEVEPFFKKLLNLMRFTDFDYTIFWRELSNCPLLMGGIDKIFACMSRAFYSHRISDDWKTMIQEYVSLLNKEQPLCKSSFATISKRMKLENPKYVPRELMLVRAYTEAQNGSFGFLLELQELFKEPYDEHLVVENMYYKLTPLAIVEDKPGYSSMSCSS